jgi:hypothetical protein
MDKMAKHTKTLRNPSPTVAPSHQAHNPVFLKTYRKQQRQDPRQMEHFYYEVIYDLIKTQMDHKEKAIKLKQLKAKLLRLSGEKGKT